MPTLKIFRVLVVYNYQPNFYLIRDQLEQLGCNCNVTEAKSGEEAIATFQINPFDLVIVDRTLVRMSGTELAAAIKAIKPQTPIIMVTGGGEEIEKPPHVDVLLHRPVTIADLQKAIETATATAS